MLSARSAGSKQAAEETDNTFICTLWLRPCLMLGMYLLVNANHCALRHIKEQQRRPRLSKPARSVGIQFNRVRRGRHDAYGMLVLAGARLAPFFRCGRYIDANHLSYKLWHSDCKQLCTSTTTVPSSFFLTQTQSACFTNFMSGPRGPFFGFHLVGFHLVSTK